MLVEDELEESLQLSVPKAARRLVQNEIPRCMLKRVGKGAGGVKDGRMCGRRGLGRMDQNASRCDQQGEEIRKRNWKSGIDQFFGSFSVCRCCQVER